MADIALKVDVDTLRGTLEGVPCLVSVLAEFGVRASFYFSLGPDHTGWALKRVFRPGFVQKAVRTSVLEHYGLKTLMYGVLLPGPDIGRRAGDVMRSVAAAGHETGIHCHDHVYWQDNVATRDEAWTNREVDRAADAYRAVFGKASRSHCAAGWQVNPYLFAREDALGMDYASDTRGTHPFLPVMGDVVARCPQLPTTLPTLDELIGRDGRTADDAVRELLELTPAGGPNHVYTLHAELEGQRLQALFRTLLTQWLARGHRLVTMATAASALSREDLPRHRVEMAPLTGRSGLLAVQGAAIGARSVK